MEQQRHQTGEAVNDPYCYVFFISSNWYFNLFSREEGGGIMVFIATFNNNAAISWLSVLLVEETGVPGENHPPAASYCLSLSHDVVL